MTREEDLISGWIADGRERAALARLKESEAAEAGDAEAAIAWRWAARVLTEKAREVENWLNRYEDELGDGNPNTPWGKDVPHIFPLSASIGTKV